MVSCSNGTHASRQFLSFPRRWRQPQPHNRRKGAENQQEEHRRRAPLLRPLHLTRRPRLTRRLHRTWRPHLARHLRLTPRPLRARRRISPRHGPPRTCRRSAQRRNRSARHRGRLPVRPAGLRPRRWRGTRRRRAPLRLRRSNSRKPQAAAAGVEQNSPSRPNPARATIRRASAGRAVQRPWALRRRGLRQQHSPLTSDATRPSNQMRPSPMG